MGFLEVLGLGKGKGNENVKIEKATKPKSKGYDRAAARQKAAKKKGLSNFTDSELDSYKDGAKRGAKSGWIACMKHFGITPDKPAKRK